MGTVFNRGTKDNPNWYVGYREHGKWVYMPSRQPTTAHAKRFVQRIEGRISRAATSASRTRATLLRSSRCPTRFSMG